ncbi:MAG: hypothetical protein WAU24_09090 [Chitinophagaceae bacterium]
MPAKLPRRNTPGLSITVKRQPIDLAPRTNGAIAIESREQAQASRDKTRRISRSGVQ